MVNSFLLKEKIYLERTVGARSATTACVCVVPELFFYCHVVFFSSNTTACFYEQFMFFESIEKSAFKVVQAGLRCGRQTKKLQKTNNSNFGDEDSTLKKRFPFHFVRVCLPLRKLQSFKVLVFL